MSLYWVARLPIKRPKGRTSVFAETGVPVHDANADVEKAIRDTIEATFPGTAANGKVRVSSKTSPAAPVKDTFKSMLHEASDRFPHDEELGEGDSADVADVPGERMKPLRYFLLIATAILFAVLSWNMGEQYWKPPHYGDYGEGYPDVPWFIWLIWVGLALNFFYLFSNSSKPSSGRISRLIGLWLDAKENELRSRAKRDV